MPNFKPKNCKKLIVDESKSDTVASKHKEFQNTFYENETVIIPKLNLQIKELEKELENKDITIDADIISLVTSRYLSDDEIIELFKKNKKAKKLLKPFI